MAASTGEGSIDSEEQAEPEWAAIPARSSPRRTASARTPPTATLTMCGARRSGSPKAWPRRTVDVASLEQRLGQAARRRRLLVRKRPGSLSAAPRRRSRRCRSRSRARPAAPVPALRRRERLESQAAADEEGAGPGRAAELVGADRDEIGAERVELDAGHDLRLRRRRRAREHPAERQQRHDLGHGLQRPDLVVAPLAVHERGPLPRPVGEQRVQVVEIDPAGRVDLEEENCARAPGRPRGRRSARRRRRSSARPARGRAGGEDGGVGGLCAAAREHDTVRGRSEQRRHRTRAPSRWRRARHGPRRAPGPGSPPRRPVEPSRPSPCRLWAQRRGRGVIEVVALAHSDRRADRAGV